MRTTNYIKYGGLVLMLVCIITACKKNDAIPTVSALNVINASPDVPAVSVNFTNPPIPYYKQQAVIGYGSFAEYSNPTGAVPISLVSSSDTTKAFYSANLNLAKGKIQSLYLFGSLPNLQTLLLEDNIPHHADSTAGVRFINLSTDAGAVSIDVQGGSTIDFTGLAYKSITAFKSYPTTVNIINNGGYTFEVKDASGNILATVGWSLQIFQNNTMVFSGNSSSGYQAFQVNNY